MMRHRNSSELLSRWDAARGAERIPARTAIEPRDLAAILPYVFILGMDAPSPKFRLAGTQVCALHGSELRGRDFLGLWTPADRRQVEVLLQGIAEDGIGALTCSEARNDRTAARFETLVLPLRGSDGQPVLIGCMSPMESHWSQGAFAFSEHGLVTMRTLVHGRTSPGAIRAAGLDGGEDVAFIDFSRRGRVPADMPSRRVRHLTVIEGGAC